jgi:hypothetical protein
MTEAPQIPVQWDGEAFRPIGRGRRDADRYFVIGERYTLVEEKQRSGASHRHYFASVNEAWTNLPEHVAGRFPTADHLRKYALIMTGFRDERTIVASSRAEAHRLAAFVRPMDEYAVVTVDGALVRVLTAKTQSMRAMDRATFQASKDAVLGYLAEMIGVDADGLARAGEAA